MNNQLTIEKKVEQILNDFNLSEHLEQFCPISPDDLDLHSEHCVQAFNTLRDQGLLNQENLERLASTSGPPEFLSRIALIHEITDYGFKLSQKTFDKICDTYTPSWISAKLYYSKNPSQDDVESLLQDKQFNNGQHFQGSRQYRSHSLNNRLIHPEPPSPRHKIFAISFAYNYFLNKHHSQENAQSDRSFQNQSLAQAIVATLLMTNPEMMTETQANTQTAKQAQQFAKSTVDLPTPIKEATKRAFTESTGYQAYCSKVLSDNTLFNDPTFDRLYDDRTESNQAQQAFDERFGIVPTNSKQG